MIHTDTGPQREKVAFWRVPAIRAILYQALAIGFLVVMALIIYKNTLANLAKRGIKTGFSFLTNEAGFAIGETGAMPLLQGKTLWLIAAVVLGGGVIFFLSRKMKKEGQELSDSTPLCLLAATLLIGLPGAVLWFFPGDIPTLHYSESSNYIAALATGLANTLKVSIVACVLSTILGLFVALARLSPNWLLSRLARWYVEINRNIPLLMQLFFWYFIVFQGLPSVRKSIELWGIISINNRGLFVPRPIFLAGGAPFVAAVVIALTAIWFYLRYVKRRQDSTGQQLPRMLPSLGCFIALPALSMACFGTPFSFDIPHLAGFNFKGGMTLTPEFVALVTGLTIYVSAFNAEIIRSGIESVSRGQREAAYALSFSKTESMKLIILPQSLRVIVPPMINEYLAVTKNSSLAVAIGYPDLVSVGGTILNQTGQAIEVIGIWMGVYLLLSRVISMGMNWYNAKIKLVER
ncbi:ABC transporter permease subunit [Desulfoluna sp.]|uniref:amino acid ABC transporter permease n=1 Tax=Desulfoluna sp. TaxID=2045199 RepID=UPI00262B4900|nr:ABC transporter permease subunit [Desulfoluna sp.]